MKVLITGGSGTLGKEIANLVFKKKYEVNILTRNKNLKSHNPRLKYFYWNPKKGVIDLNFVGKSFLHNQVRIIVGTLVSVGRGKIEVDKVKEILDSRDRTKAGPTAPPDGLYLDKIIY